MAPETRYAIKRRRFEASAAALTASQDMMLEILMRLPPKTLAKCKSVSKLWYTMLSNPIFFSNYAKINRNRPSGFIMNCRQPPYPEFFFVSLTDGVGISRRNNPRFLRIPQIKIRNLCNGLLCYSTPHINNPLETSFYVCNPASGQTKMVGVVEDSKLTNLLCVYLAFDPINSAFYNLVFVYFVIWLKKWTVNVIRFEIYSSRTESWIRQGPIGELFIVPSELTFGGNNGAHWNGAIYWYHEVKNCVSFFDVETCSHNLLPMPELEMQSSNSPDQREIDYIGEFGGGLHLIGFRRWSTVFTVFEVEKDRSGVTVMYRGDFSSFGTGFPDMVMQGDLYSVVTVLQGEGEEMMSIVVQSAGCLIQYNFKDKSVKMICELPRGCDCDYHSWDYMRLTTFQCIQTLASP